jgi:dihydrofolate synthase/folylpolyglutamate synthase
MSSSPFFPTWESLAGHLDSLGLFRMKPGLERVHEGMMRLNLAKPSMALVHIVGTNGKGSTAALLHAIASAHGYTTGVFTSPHFVTPRERIRIGGEMLSREVWLDLAHEVYAACPHLDFSYFELLTLMAMLAFERHGVDLAIVEAGLGGTWDATSVFPHDVTLVTPVGLDHEQVLGPTLEAIAKDKAGAIRGGEVVCAPQQPGIADIFRTRADAQGAGFREIPRDGGFVCPDGSMLDLDQMQLGLAGTFQKTNARLALAGWSVCSRIRGWSFSPLECMQGLSGARHPGRMQIIPGNPRVLLDGAHNLMGLTALGRSLHELHFDPEVMIFSCMKDKNLLEHLDMVRALCPGLILVPAIPGNTRAMEPQELARLLGPRARACSGMHEALDILGKNAQRGLVCGSLFLLGEYFRLRPDTL